MFSTRSGEPPPHLASSSVSQDCQTAPMPNSPSAPTIRRRRLGSVLRSLRITAGLSTGGAAEALGWKPPKLSKIEGATQQISPEEVTTLLRCYGVDDEGVIATLRQLAVDAGRKGWWQTYAVVSPAYADYISLEADAKRIFEWSYVVPGLLQTAAYARETITGMTSSRTRDEINSLVEVRMARQAVLTRSGQPLEFSAIIHETALHQRFAVRPETMRDQLRRLLDAADLPNVSIQIMPLDAVAHPGQPGGFSLVRFPGPPSPDIVLLEHLSGATYVEGNDAFPFSDAVERIRVSALSVDESTARIKSMEKRHKK